MSPVKPPPDVNVLATARLEVENHRGDVDRARRELERAAAIPYVSGASRLAAGRTFC